jgi:hypothetical protein
VCGAGRSAETNLKKEMAMAEQNGVSRKELSEKFAGNEKRVGFFRPPYYLSIIQTFSIQLGW